MTELLRSFEAARERSHKLLVAYLVAGAPDEATSVDALAAVARHVDAIEIGVPFSDPLMDGPVIAAAAERALRNGISPRAALDLGARAIPDTRRIVMTYYNPVHKLGEEVFCKRARELGYLGVIVPDLPVEESTSLRRSAAEMDLAWIPLIAPTTSAERAQVVAATATGFVYAVSTLGVTGRRDQLSERVEAVVSKCREVTNLPVLVGIGVSTPDQAREVAGLADGAVVGTAFVNAVNERGPAAAGELAAELRAALTS